MTTRSPDRRRSRGPRPSAGRKNRVAPGGGGLAHEGLDGEPIRGLPGLHATEGHVQPIEVLQRAHEPRDGLPGIDVPLLDVAASRALGELGHLVEPLRDALAGALATEDDQVDAHAALARLAGELLHLERGRFLAGIGEDDDLA